NLIILPGKALRSPYDYQYQCNIIYELVEKNNMDAVVLATGALCNFIDARELKKLCDRIKPIPVISISIPLHDIPSVLTDNHIGYKNALNHLIKDHGKRRIAFIQGPSRNIEAVERFRVYREVLKENNLEFDTDLVCAGDFTVYGGINAIKILIDERKVYFDALAASNDEMALSAMKTLQERGIRVPENISVIGFDNVEESKISNPGLTTVRQPIYEQARRAFGLALDVINGKKVENIMLDTETVIRESCGCLPQMIEHASDNGSYKSNMLQFLDAKECVDEFVAANVLKLNPMVFIHERVNAFLTGCYKEIVMGTLDERTLKQLLVQFKDMINYEQIKEDDVSEMQSIITNIRSNLISKITDKAALKIAEDFFHTIRVLVIDMIMKEQSRRWTLHHDDIRGLRNVLNMMISKVHDKDSDFNPIIKELNRMRINICYIYLYKHEIINGRNSVWKHPEYINQVLSYNAGETCFSDSKEIEVRWDEIFSDGFLPNNKRYTLIVNPLFFMEYQFGIMVCDFNISDRYVFESLFTEMSCALKLSFLINSREQIENKLRDTLIELEGYNKKLNHISQTDEMTGLYNRRGFLNQACKNLKVCKEMAINGLLFYADMDGLKDINDMYGHEEGDTAIKAMADILKKAFRKADIIARLGGDEFTAFISNIDNDFSSEMRNRIQSYTDEYNNDSGKPYKISVSMGSVFFGEDAEWNENLTMSELMRRADMSLYEEKKSKRGKRGNSVTLFD
ncbi:MAG TPA: diguanylate cyclase, partial [Clostridia bacterium]